MNGLLPTIQPPFATLAFIEGIGGMEMMLVAVIGLLLFGGKGLPDMARTIGKAMREFKKATANIETEVKRVMEEETVTPPAPRPAPPASIPRPIEALEPPPAPAPGSSPTPVASSPLPPAPASPPPRSTY
ncbi:MAG: twin-arginine translocase TatA/TatE family subunit [Verrucomicrobia bacterium]|nr:twin-arginine translocase TatA/TatE family subunit [Verrucomicrobiota bacterium]